MYKYDLGHISLVVFVVHCCKVRCTERERETKRERERVRCLHCITAAACGEEEDKRLLPLCFRVIVFLSHKVYFTACGLSWFFPLCGFSTLYLVFDIVLCFVQYLICNILPSIRLWPNDLLTHFLTKWYQSVVWRKKWMIH